MNSESSPAKRKQIKKSRWFACLALWWVIAACFYLYLSNKEKRMVEDVIVSGVEAGRKSAENAGLPLLERDVQALTRLARSVAETPGVVSMSIIDHKNKIIAFTDVGSLFQAPADKVEADGGVSYWPRTLPDGRRVICFSADIEFSGTKIGEVILAKDTRDTGAWRILFISLAAVSLGLIVFALLVADFHGIAPLWAALKQKVYGWIGIEDGLPGELDVVCPLCGHQKPFTRSFLLQANLNRYPVLRTSATDIRSAQLLDTTGIHLREIAGRHDLGWFRLQVIHRCADIIKRLAGN